MKEPIFITGIARSGTSLIAGIINLSEAFMGNTFQGNRHNPKGMFENIDIIDNLVKPYLKNNNLDPKCQYPLPDFKKLNIDENWNKKVKSIFENQGYKEGPWAIKDAKMVMLWPIWSNAFPNAKWIIVRRSEDKIIDSCVRTSFMDRFNDKNDWQWWIDKHLEQLSKLKENVKFFEIWTEEAIENRWLIKNMINWLNLKYDHQKIDEFIDQKLFHS